MKVYKISGSIVFEFFHSKNGGDDGRLIFSSPL